MELIGASDLSPPGKPMPDARSRPKAKTAPSLLAGYSIFHEPWWLDIATRGQWSVVQSPGGGGVEAEMPYFISKKGIWPVSGLPPFTRTLGPVVKSTGTQCAEELRSRLRVLSDLIDRLPDFHKFYQTFDPRVEDAVAFLIKGFSVTQTYTLQIAGERSLADVWSGMRPKTRSAIRAAEAQLEIRAIPDPRAFVNFYESNLADRLQQNIYERGLMLELVDAFLSRGAGRLLGAFSRDGRLAASIGVVWDKHAMYYLLSSRSQTAHNGSISLLLWRAINEALERGINFDFDGIANASILYFLSGFGGTLVPRISVERAKPTYRAARSIRHAIDECSPKLRGLRI
jgi:hypothetical protein